jgi:arsenite methyltransferase
VIDLACPACGGALSLECFEPDKGSSCREGVLDCRECRAWYPVTGSIPRLLVPGPLRLDEAPFLARWRDRLGSRAASVSAATPGDASHGGPKREGQAQVQGAFGHKWTRQPWWGMDGESARMIEEWLLPRYGWPTQDAYRSFLRSRRFILDAGSGLGREALRMAKANPAAQVVGLELSECVDAAAEHARRAGMPNVTFVQADLMAPPFPAGTFDFIFSEGVLHHTPDTRAAFRSLARLLRPDGEIAFYVYRKKAPLREFADDNVREQLQGLAPADAWTLMEPLTRLGQALAELKAEVVVPEDVQVLGIRAGRYDVQRLVYYSMFKCFWNERLSFDENVHVNFDWYYPRFAWRHTEEEVRGWLAEAGLRVTHENVEESGITIRASHVG